MNRAILIMAGVLATAVLCPVQVATAMGNDKNAVEISTQIRKQKKAMRDLMLFGSAIASYINESGRAPAGDFHAIVKARFAAWNIPAPSTLDPWGNAYIYFKSPLDPASYALACRGRDGKFKGWGQSGAYVMEDLDDFGQDIIFSNGEFTFAPQVKEGIGRNGGLDLETMDKAELIDRYHDLRIRQIEIDGLVRMLDGLDAGLRAIEAKAIRIELLKLEQRRVTKILESIYSEIAPANSYVEKISLKGDLLNLNVVVPLPEAIDQILRQLEANGRFTQVRLVQEPLAATGAGRKSMAIISCRYNIENAGAESMFAPAVKRDYQGIRGQLGQKLKALEAKSPRQPEAKAQDTAISGLAKGEITRRIRNLEQQIRQAESQEHRLAGIRAGKQKLQQRLENLKGCLPGRNEVESARLEMLRLIQESGSDLAVVRQLPKQTDVSHIEHPFALSIKGDYPKLRQLSEQLAAAKHIFIIREFELAVDKEMAAAGGLRAEMIVSFCLYNDLVPSIFH